MKQLQNRSVSAVLPRRKWNLRRWKACSGWLCAPSGMNDQTREFVVVDDREVLTAMQKLSPGARALLTVPLAIVGLEWEIPRRIDMGPT